ncbi:MAG: protein kinase [Deltaproteobacteria bacterium]|nr:protein kinase [Deltaproteobacteria bacterium]
MSASNTPPPNTLGRYRVVRRLGAGGMAEVFLAKYTGAESIEKLLVVKRILPTFARSPKFVSMFVDEAKLAMRLNHPNIVQVYAFEQVKEEFLLAMEFVDGLDLGRVLSAARRRGRRMPYAVAALLVMEIAKGLDYAHNRKDEAGIAMEIVHRDVSPQNVLVSYDGAVKVADFGIARARMISEETGVIKGKFSYMSPEQARGQRVDRRSDVYSLGVLFAELLMNRIMYPGLQGMEILEQVRDGRTTQSRAVDPYVPEELDAIATKAMAVDREERYQTCRSLAGALSRWLHSQEELHDAAQIEAFLADVAPREVTQAEAAAARAPGELGAQATMLSHASGLPPPGGRELRERRNVVVVVGKLRDLGVGTEGAGERTGVAAASQAMRVLEDIAFKYDAVMEWPEGPEKLAFRFVLGIGRASADDPLHASRLALDVLDALEGLSADAIAPLTAAMGVSRGLVATIRQGNARARFEPIGNVFDVAKELGAAAGPSEVLASGEVYRLARRIFSFEDDGTRSVSVPSTDGARTLRAYRLKGARTREERAKESAQLASQVGLVGRASEIQALVESYAEVVSQGKSIFLAIAGEIGVGKTALVAAAMSRFRPDPVLIQVDCPFGMQEVPYAALNDLLREAWGIDEDVPPEQAKQRVREQVRRVIKSPDRREAAIEAFEAIIAPDKRATDVGDRSQRLLQAVRDFLTGVAQKAPTVLWIDSVQFADGPTSELLARLFLQPIQAPLLVIVCARPDTRIDPVLRGLLRIDLEELTDDDRRSLVEAHLGGAHVPPDVHTAIIHRAGGNPFFLKELLDALLERGVLRFEEGPERRIVRRTGAAFALPSTLEDVIAARIGELADRERTTLRWLAVVGAGVSPVEVGQLMGLDASESLQVLEERGLVVRRPGGSLAFPSVIVRQVAYESIDAEDRGRLHKRVAQYLSGLANKPPPARIARHFELAGEGVLAARAYREAGFLARSVYSNRDALRFFARALALLPETSNERFELHEVREQILRVLSMRSDQRVELEQMRAIAERARDPKLLAIAYDRLARHDLDIGRGLGVDALLRKALDAAISAGDRASEIEALRLLGHLRRDQGDTVGAVEALDRALIRAGNEPEHLAARGLTLANRGTLQWRAGNVSEATESAAESIAIFRRLGLKGYQAHALNSLGVALLSTGAFEDAIACIRASVVLDREAGDRIHVGRKVSNVGQIYAELGDTARAREFMERALYVFDRADDAGGRADTLSALAELMIEQVGDLDRAAELLDEARKVAERLDDAYDLAHERIVRAEWHFARGDVARAESTAKEGVTHARAAATLAYELLAAAVQSRCLARLDRKEEAIRLATGVIADVTTRGSIERAERILAHSAQALFDAGERDRARDAASKARGVLDARLVRVRDESLKNRYLDTPVARLVRDLESAPT